MVRTGGTRKNIFSSAEHLHCRNQDLYMNVKIILINYSKMLFLQMINFVRNMENNNNTRIVF